MKRGVRAAVGVAGIYMLISLLLVGLRSWGGPGWYLFRTLERLLRFWDVGLVDAWLETPVAHAIVGKLVKHVSLPQAALIVEQVASLGIGCTLYFVVTLVVVRTLARQQRGRDESE